MSSFLINLVRRGAGLPVTKIQAPPPSPLGPGVHNQGDGPAEGAITGNTVNQTPLPASSSAEMPSEELIPHAPSIRHLYGTESNTPIRPSIGELTTVNSTPSLGSPQAPQRHLIPLMREAEVAPMEPPERQEPAVPPFQADREVISPVAQTIELMNEPERQASTVVPGPPIRVREAGETQETRAPTLSVAMIRPAPADLPLLQSPKVTSAPSPTSPSQLPIHVRIGRVEVRANSAPTPTPARPSSPAPVGFAAYYRMRNYRS